MNEDDILQHCLVELAAGRKTPAECAASYPQVRDLADQLEAAHALMTWPPASLSAAAVRRHHTQIRAAVRAGRQPRPARAVAPWLRLAMAAALAAVLVLGGAGTLSAAAASLPGQALYGLKRAAEAVQGAFVSNTAEAAWHLSLAEERLEELQALAARPNTEIALLQVLAAEISAETDAALASVENAPADQIAAMLEKLLASIERQQAVLARVMAQVSPTAQASIEQAMTISGAQREKARQRLLAVHNGGLPPGLASRTPGTPTNVPPGQARQTATVLPPGHVMQTATAQAGGHVPPGQASRTPGAPTDLPPGQANKTATATVQAAQATPTPPGSSGGQGGQGGPNCSAGSPNSPNYCTPTPGAPPEGNGDNGGDSHETSSNPPSGDPPPTECPLNPAGKPVCSNRP